MEEVLNLLKGQVKLNKVEFKDGKVKLSGLYDASGVDIELGLSLEPNLFLDLIAKAIPGSIDDLVINYIKSALPNLIK